MAGFQQKSDEFVQWFKSQSGAYFHPDITLADLRSSARGRGIIAKEDIPAETDLFKIPRVSLLSLENSDLSKILPDIFQSPSEAVDAEVNSTPLDTEDDEDSEVEETLISPRWHDLILVLLYEYLQGSSSPWKAYFDVLPQDLDSLIFWADGELDQLQASTIKDEIGREVLIETFRHKILPLVKKHKDVFFRISGALSDERMVELCHQLGSLIVAYAFELDPEGDGSGDSETGSENSHQQEGRLAMVPMADMLNADAEFNAHLDHGEEVLTMRSLRSIKSGEEILNYYGPLTNAQLLRRYGYTSAKHSRYDEFELPGQLVCDAIDSCFGRQVATETGEDGEKVPAIEGSFILERESGAPDEEGRLSEEAKLKDFPEELKETVAAILMPALDIDIDNTELDEKQSQVLRKTFLYVVQQAIKMGLSKYKTTAEEDEALLLRVLDRRQQMAIAVRLGEKNVAREALSLIERRLQDLEDDARPRKRRRK